MNIIQHLKSRNFADHPCLKKIGPERSALPKVHAIMANARAFSAAQRRYLATLIAPSQFVKELDG